MLTQEQITYILQELGLDVNDQTARKTIERLVESRPDVVIDKRFIASLREDLQSKANVISVAHEIKSTKSTNIFSIFMNKALASALVVMVALVAGGLWYIQQTNKPLFSIGQNGGDNQLLSGKYGVTGVGEESFGDLAKVAIVEGGRGGNNAANNAGNAEMAAAPNTATTDQKMAAGNNPVGTGMGGDASILPYPAPTNYEFAYEGEALPEIAADQNVLKRTKPNQNPTIVDRIINMLSFGLVDLSKFRDVKLQNFTFVEDREFGYGIGVDLQNGYVNIYQNWEKWPQPEYVTCLGMEICPPAQSPVKIEDLPSDEEAIAIADAFLAEYSVSKEGYGTPFVNNQWRTYYERSSDKRSYYIPEQVQVTYPLVLEGSPVYDEGGYQSGMSVMVDARTKRATSINELTTKQFERSQYRGETDSNKILEVAKRGGFRNYPYVDPNAKNVTLELQTPTVQMVKIWYSTDNYRTNNELYVPAMIFPIKNWQETGYWRQNVIVPLVADILNSDRNPSQPVPMPIPVDDAPIPVEPDGGNGSSSSGAAGSGVSSSVRAEPAVLPAVDQR